MASHWPRSRLLKLHGMLEYQNSRKTAKNLRNGVDRMYRQIAAKTAKRLLTA